MTGDLRNFIYRLAWQLGYANPEIMLQEMEPYQLREWADFIRENKDSLWPT